jgi:hypothetical protein
MLHLSRKRPLVFRHRQQIGRLWRLSSEANSNIKQQKMEVMNSKIEPKIERSGSDRTFFMVPREKICALTEGSYLEYVTLKGKALIQIENEKQEV